MFPENGDRFIPIRRNRDAIAPAFERHTGDFAKALVIFGKQERFRAAPKRFRLGAGAGTASDPSGTPAGSNTRNVAPLPARFPREYGRRVA